MNKKQLRQSIILKLKSQTNNEKEQIEQQLTSQLVDSGLWHKSKIIGITISQGVEWNTEPIIRTAWDQGKLVCVPKCFPDENKLIFYKIQSYEELEVVYNNLLEPIQEETEQINKGLIDLLIVPGLLFDTSGFRIGFGGGYYDRFLTDFPNATVSLLSQQQLVGSLPTEQYDIPVNYLITEQGIVK